ncbi:hypothetical protein [Leptospira ainlahdjerensis]|uniref:hypothetical protein n=1 Tax=Leptospira ainlahdjerensis TaxID=2810033 RepID=UPI001964801D|nr:hypothetical protein [Leptospira ainlahdjerensis]
MLKKESPLKIILLPAGILHLKKNQLELRRSSVKVARPTQISGGGERWREKFRGHSYITKT